MHESFNHQLGKNLGNYASLSPMSLIAWAADVYPDRCALVHANQSQSWAETYTRCRRFASALSQLGVKYGDTVAIMAPNTPAMFEAHYGIPMVGGVINALNTRLDASAIAFMLQHGDAKVLLVDREFTSVVNAALDLMDKSPILIDIADINLPYLPSISNL